MTSGPTKRRITASLSLLALLFQRAGSVLGVGPERLALAVAAFGLVAASSGVTYWAVSPHAPRPGSNQTGLNLAPPQPVSRAAAAKKKLKAKLAQLTGSGGPHSGGALQATRGHGPVKKAGAGPAGLFERRPHDEVLPNDIPERRKKAPDSQPPPAVKPFERMKKLGGVERFHGARRSEGIFAADGVGAAPMSEARDRPLIPEVDSGRAVDAAPGLSVGKPDLSPSYVYEAPEQAPGGMPARMTGNGDGGTDEIRLDPNRAYLHEDAAKIKR